MNCRDKVETLHAPARINILGEHIDYVSYLPTASLTFGSDKHRMVMRFKPSIDREVQGSSAKPGFEPFAFELEAVPGTQSWNDYIFSTTTPTPHWSNYVRGAVAYAVWKYGPSIRSGFEFFVESDIPSGGGASSSSALTVLAGAAIRRVNGIETTPEELARDSAQAEWFTGTRGGDMDHLTICLAESGQAVHLRYSESSSKHVALPSGGVRWVTCFSHPANKGAEAMLAYNERAAVSRILIPALLADAGSVNNLPETIRLAEFARMHPEAMEKCLETFPALERERSPLRIRDRALHHLGEVRRVERAVSILETESGVESEAIWEPIGKSLDESHASLRDLYQVSTPQVESLHEKIRSLPGVYGARLMGGGFGGNVLALVSADVVEEFVRRVEEDYYTPLGRQATDEGAIMVSTPGPGLTLAAG